MAPQHSHPVFLSRAAHPSSMPGGCQFVITFLCMLLMQVGAGIEADTDVGPVISPEAKLRCERLIQAGIDAGASCLLDGRGVKVCVCVGGGVHCFPSSHVLEISNGALTTF